MNPFDTGFYGDAELATFGFKSLGTNVVIDKTCRIYGLKHVSIGSNVRIDGYSTIVAGSAGFNVGSHVHIAGGCHISGGFGVTFEDFSGISQGVRIYSGSDDYSGNHLTNPTVPEEFLGTKSGRVTLCRHVIIGSGSVILPGVTIGEGSSVGALSLVTKNLDPWGMYFGSPVRRLKGRSRRLLELEALLGRGES